MPICPITGLSFDHHELEHEHYERFDLPLPEIHPTARAIQMLAFANSWDLYWTTDARDGKKILSQHDPSEHPLVYDHSYWMSKDFDTRTYGCAFDFSRPFFEQYFEMVARIPEMNLTIVSGEHVDYCNNVLNSRRCYLSFNISRSENLLYCTRSRDSKDSMHLYNSDNCEQCFALVGCNACYQVFWSEFSENCTNARFLSNCNDCIDCYQCANLSHKQYCIQNKQYSKNDYERIVGSIDFSSHATVEEEHRKWEEFLGRQPLRAQRNISCEDSTGILMRNCKLCVQCMDLRNAEQCVRCWGGNVAQSSDAGGWDGQYCTGVMGFASIQNTAQCLYIVHSYDVMYSQKIFQSHDCFGCFGVKNADHCIFNKQYPIAEYESLKAKIIAHMKETGEWGHFFPVKYAPSPYEKSLARCVTMTEFDDDPEVVARLGLRWDVQKDDVPHSDALLASELPDSSDDANESLVGKVFACVETGRPYSMIKQELAFYKKHRVPLPRISWRTAIEERYPVFYPAPHAVQCAQCGVQMYSYLRPDKTTRRMLCDTCFSAIHS